MILFPNAKINIGLNIISKRADGYHDIETLMMPVDWHDILEIVPSRGHESTLTVYGNKIDCPIEDNLVMKAYRYLQREYNIPTTDLYLSKIIPDGAGLGGGSSDASFTLIGLNNLYNLGLSQEKLSGIAATLGSDCPFFIYNTPMIASGTGTVLSPVDINLSEYTVVIAKPSNRVPTREAYSGTKPAAWPQSLTSLVQKGDIFKLKNDFEISVFPLHPAIMELKEYFVSNGAIYSAMSGSGSSVFALFNTRDEAVSVSEPLKLHNILHIGKFI